MKIGDCHLENSKVNILDRVYIDLENHMFQR